MTRTFWLYSAALTVFLAVPMNAEAGGSEKFQLSTYTCSDVYWGGKKAGDNCVATDEEKLEVLDSMGDDGDDDDDE